MSRRILKVESYLLAFSFMVALILFSTPFAFAKSEDQTIVIYHTNDIHGKVNSTYNGNELTQIGLDVIASIKESDENSILVDAGDATQGVPLGKLSKGSNIIDLMNAAGYDGMTLGNHEFDYGASAVMELAKEANFPVVSANTYYNGDPFLADVNGNNGCNFVKEFDGKKIGFFGITTKETNKTTIPENLEGITFKDEKEISKQQVEELKEMNCDVIVGIMHIGVDSSSDLTSREIAQDIPDIDIIIDGHSHTVMTEMVGNTLIQQTGTNSVDLGKIEIKFDQYNQPVISSRLISAKEIGQNYQPDPRITDMYSNLMQEISSQLDKVVGKTETTLYGGNYNGKNISRMVETNLGSLIADSMVYQSEKILDSTIYENLPIVALENGGAVRSSIDKGFINMGDILQVLPLDNRLSIQIISSKTLFETIERGVCKQYNPDAVGEAINGFFGGYPQISGMRIEYDITETPYDTEYPENGTGERVKKIVLLNDDGTDKQEIYRDDDEFKLAFACNDYTITEYPMVSDIEVYQKGDYLSNVLADYITKLTFDGDGSFIYPFNQSRSVLLKQNNIFGDYDAQIIVEENGELVADKEVNVKIDNNDSQNFNTDDNGSIEIKDLETGGHQIFITYDGKTMDGCVDETVGIKSINIDVGENSVKDVESTINIISQLDSQQGDDYYNMLTFARTSYDSLTDQKKAMVTNYDELVKAENQGDNFLYENRTYIVSIFSFLLAVCIVVFLIAEKRKRYKR